MKSYLPDVNVWLALAYAGHQHHPIASAWFYRVEAEQERGQVPFLPSKREWKKCT